MLFLLPQPFPFLLPSNLSPPKTFFRGLKSQQGFKKKRGVTWGSLDQMRRRRVKEFNLLLMSILLRTPLQLKIWCPRLKLLNLSPGLIPKRILINRRPRYRILALFLLFSLWPCASRCDTCIYHLMKAFFFLFDLNPE